jgi:TRAP-type C4-dicarboxylate transport system permease small subunit
VVNAGALARFEARFGTLLEALALVASLALLAMVATICGDVLTRNVAVPGLPRGIAWSNEISELLLYAMHIRVDILLRALPLRVAYACEWIADALGFACCLWLVFYGASAARKSWAGDALSIKTLVMPEWWILAPLPICFLLLAIEFVFRMRRLRAGPIGPRDDAVSAA